MSNTIINLPVNGHDVTFHAESEMTADRARELVEWTTRLENDLRGETPAQAQSGAVKAGKKFRLDPMYIPNRVEKIADAVVPADPVFSPDVVVFASV